MTAPLIAPESWWLGLEEAEVRSGLSWYPSISPFPIPIDSPSPHPSPRICHRRELQAELEPGYFRLWRTPEPLRAPSRRALPLLLTGLAWCLGLNQGLGGGV